MNPVHTSPFISILLIIIFCGLLGNLLLAAYHRNFKWAMVVFFAMLLAAATLKGCNPT